PSKPTPRPRAGPQICPRNHKTSHRSKKPPVGRSLVPGADHSIIGSAVLMAVAVGVPAADRNQITLEAASVGGLFRFKPSARCRLLMLWTAPPPARECHECGCC